MSENVQSFSEYLVENQIVKVDDMVSAMIQQIKFTPTVSEVVFEEKMLKPETILSVISLQAKKKIDFIAAAKELSLWNEELEKKVFEYMDKIQKPFVERLIDEQILSFESLNQHLDSYLGSITQNETQASIVETPEPTISLQAEVNPAVAVKESAGSSAVSPEILVFAQMFDETAKNSIKESISKESWQMDDALLELLNLLASTAEMASLNRMGGLFASAAILIQNSRSGIVDPTRTQKLGLLLKNAVEPLWSFRESIVRNGKEETFEFENPAMNQVVALLQNFLESEK